MFGYYVDQDGLICKVAQGDRVDRWSGMVDLIAEDGMVVDSFTYYDDLEKLIKVLLEDDVPGLFFHPTKF